MDDEFLDVLRKIVLRTPFEEFVQEACAGGKVAVAVGAESGDNGILQDPRKYGEFQKGLFVHVGSCPVFFSLSIIMHLRKKCNKKA